MYFIVLFYTSRWIFYVASAWQVWESSQRAIENDERLTAHEDPESKIFLIRNAIFQDRIHCMKINIFGTSKSTDSIFL